MSDEHFTRASPLECRLISTSMEIDDDDEDAVQVRKAVMCVDTCRWKVISDEDRECVVDEAQIRLKAAELMAKYGAQVNIAEINAIMERDRETIRQTAKAQSQGLFTGNVPTQNL